MVSLLDKKEIALIEKYFVQCGVDRHRPYELLPLSGDGSDRRFIRIVQADERSCLIVFPSTSLPKAREEAESCHKIGSHLARRKISVPEIYFFDHATGAIAYEDLGDTLLFDMALAKGIDKSSNSESGFSLAGEVKEYYYKTIEQLVNFQVKGREGFKTSFCWETKRYNKQIMLERESGYFLNAFCYDYLQLPKQAEKLNEEFLLLAERAAHEPSDYLLHRDFQSRNIMIYRDNIKIIDFQGARLGPLAYDLASLINDPYVCLPYQFREELMSYYIEMVNKYTTLDRTQFVEGYHHIALQRNLQILGAFAFLTKVKGKKFFAAYIKPAVHDLHNRLDVHLRNSYPLLAGLAKDIFNMR